jgi:uncharacterized protein YhaN
MRLRRLDLVRYGKFTDRSLDFGDRPEGAPDLHVIHGPNEAGKSTLFSAWLDFLYGIDFKSPYNFLHDYKTMRIGAEIETSAGRRHLVRVKKQVGSLLDDRDQPVGDHVLAAALGGLDRDAYRAMFSLDETSLEEGGEEILKSKGDLGQLLFSASAGLADLAGRLDTIRGEAERFFRPRAQKTELADLKRRLDELKAEREAIDLAAGEHARLVSERDRARGDFDLASRNRAELRLRLDQLGRKLAALPLMARLEALRAQLSAMAQPPAVPDGWEAEIPDLGRSDIALSARFESSDRSVAALEAERDALPPADPILDRAQAIDALQELAGRAAGEEKDLPNRFAERDAAERAIAGILVRLGRPGDDPAGLVLPARLTGRIKALMAEQSGLAERRSAAEREVRAAEAALRDLRRVHAADLGTVAADVDHAAIKALADLLSDLRTVDFASRRDRARRAVEEAKDQVHRCEPALRPWSGSVAALAGLLAPPMEVLAALTSDLAEIAAARSRQEAELAGLAADLAGLEAERRMVAAVPGVLDDAEVTAIRQAREAAWTAHYATLDAESADVFRTALLADDAAFERRLAQVGETSRLRGFDQSIARGLARRQVLEEALARTIGRQTALQARLSELVLTTSPQLPADIEIAAFAAWCAALATAQAAARALGAAEVEHVEVARAEAEACLRLAEAMAAAGLPAGQEDFTSLRLSAQRFLDREAKHGALRETLQRSEIDLDYRRTALADSCAAAEAWEAAWREACAGTWLAESGAPPSVAEMGEVLDLLGALQATLHELNGHSDRIGKMERDIATFATEIGAIAAAVGSPDLPPQPLYRGLRERLGAAREIERRRSDVAARAEKIAAERADLVGEIACLRNRIGEICGHFGVGTLAEVEACLGLLAERRRLAADIAGLSAELADSLGVTDEAEAAAALGGLDRAGLEREIEELRPLSDGLDDETNRLYAAFTQAESRLSGLGDDDRAARLAAARRTVLVEIEEGARHYLELRLGTLATDWALRLYRDRHRSSMLERASLAFSELSRGNYTGLAAQRDGNQETLIALGADGSSKQADGLSKGTQFQLYLALRVAGYDEYARTRPPVPFIADDIMESFDEARAAEALRQLSGMANVGQVIYLTHHEHIVEIARAIAPGVKVHTL